jgi:hypothetical protein
MTSCSVFQKIMPSLKPVYKVGLADRLPYFSRPAARQRIGNWLVERFAELLQDALWQVPIRKKTRVSKGAKLRRLEEKKQQSLLKKERSKRVPIED